MGFFLCGDCGSLAPGIMLTRLTVGDASPMPIPEGDELKTSVAFRMALARGLALGVPATDIWRRNGRGVAAAASGVAAGKPGVANSVVVELATDAGTTSSLLLSLSLPSSWPCSTAMPESSSSFSRSTTMLSLPLRFLPELLGTSAPSSSSMRCWSSSFRRFFRPGTDNFFCGSGGWDGGRLCTSTGFSGGWYTAFNATMRRCIALISLSIIRLATRNSSFLFRQALASWKCDRSRAC
mmetsp:Transcript_56765/g.124472  ORF Transcript_56765/g.124472 Transcript_56765/m.124472 type:complete len:238 (-) Transcript_56765:643-1356(-)